jgi:hypothetical protein
MQHPSSETRKLLGRTQTIASAPAFNVSFDSSPASLPQPFASIRHASFRSDASFATSIDFAANHPPCAAFAAFAAASGAASIASQQGNGWVRRQPARRRSATSHRSATSRTGGSQQAFASLPGSSTSASSTTKNQPRRDAPSFRHNLDFHIHPTMAVCFAGGP